MDTSIFKFTKKQLLMIFVASMGYFVDIYDLLIFNTERVESLKSLGIVGKDSFNAGLSIQIYQTLGLIIGGLLFGVLGDKRGRPNTLFFSIFAYSAATIACVFVKDATTFSILRFIAGLGLAGELGVALTWISENLEDKKRTIATTIVSAVGLCGGITAALVADHFSWKSSYILGGVLGFLLLALRLRVKESDIYKELKTQSVKRGSLFNLLSNKIQRRKYFACILAGAPAFVFMSVFVTFSTEIFTGVGFEIKNAIPKSVTYYLIAFAASDILCGLLSKYLGKRKLPLLIYSGIQVLALIYFFSGSVLNSPSEFYLRVAFLGFSVGMWGVLITNSIEQFGTEIRSTVATSVPNLIRGVTIPASLVFSYLTSNYFSGGKAGFIIGMGLILISVISILLLEDKFERGLKFNEDANK